MIEYLYKEGAVNETPIRVRLDGKVCGNIIATDGGFQYMPDGVKCGGEVFRTIEEVQDSLVDE